MDITAFRAELEGDWAWRIDELRFFQNIGSTITNLDEEDRYRRVLVLILYAHFEGFCKVALGTYVNAVNRLGVNCGEANYAIAAAGLADLFRELRDPNRKSDLFRRTLPDDAKLHRFARDREFVELTDHFGERAVNIPDYVVDTESNLTPVVLRKNLFRLGFDHDLFAHLDGDVNRLLGYRNNIAHGAAKAGMDRKTYEALRDAVIRIIHEVTALIAQSFQEKKYLRSQQATAPPTADAKQA
jgi:hypothetical protein